MIDIKQQKEINNLIHFLHVLVHLIHPMLMIIEQAIYIYTNKSQLLIKIYLLEIIISLFELQV
jgi:hypothetical protein